MLPAPRPIARVSASMEQEARAHVSPETDLGLAPPRRLTWGSRGRRESASSSTLLSVRSSSTRSLSAAAHRYVLSPFAPEPAPSSPSSALISRFSLTGLASPAGMAPRDAPQEHERRMRPRLPSIRPLLEVYGALDLRPPPPRPLDTSSAFRRPPFPSSTSPSSSSIYAHYPGSWALSDRADPPSREPSRRPAAPPPPPRLPLSPPLSSTSPPSHNYGRTYFYNERHPQRGPTAVPQPFDPPQRWFSTTFRTTSGARAPPPAFIGQQPSRSSPSRPTSASPPRVRPPSSASSIVPLPAALPSPSRPPSPTPTLSPLSPPDSTAASPATASRARPHRCTTCAKAFARRHDLTRHERVHSGELCVASSPSLSLSQLLGRGDAGTDEDERTPAGRSSAGSAGSGSGGATRGGASLSLPRRSRCRPLRRRGR